MKPTHKYDEELQKAERIAYLIAGHLQDSLTPAEQDELDDWIVESDENLELFEQLTDEDNIETGIQQYLQTEREKAQALSGVKSTIERNAQNNISRKIWPYLIAASLIFIAVSLYLFTTNNKQKDIEKPIVQQSVKDDVKAGSDKAVLTLSDGRTIILDSLGTGLLTEDNGVMVTKQDRRELTYKSSAANPTGYNTLSIPRGGHYRLTLPDGSKVWLNAESSLRYPIAFQGAERSVELKGEGYFEVAKDAAKPFVVTIVTPSGEGGMVRVLGTHFNIDAYKDEGNICTTLLEGSIQITKGKLSKVIKPGEQAIINGGIKVTEADINEATAWKEGKFIFRDASIRSIGAQIKRWYDVEVVYQGNIQQHFNTEANRSVSLSKLLDALEGTGQVHFVLEGKKLIIKP